MSDRLTLTPNKPIPNNTHLDLKRNGRKVGTVRVLAPGSWVAELRSPRRVVYGTSLRDVCEKLRVEEWTPDLAPPWHARATAIMLWLFSSGGRKSPAPGRRTAMAGLLKRLAYVAILVTLTCLGYFVGTVCTVAWRG